MTTREIRDALELEVVNEGDMSREVTGGYCGDLLSWVMGRAPADSVWITVMGNVNAVAVAVLADVACILLAEDSPLDEAAASRAGTQGVTILRSPRPAYELAAALEKALAAGN